ncbi:DUF305 domain-containing protein [Streptomyces spongiicola]|uniref:DUF305 domain-containing protein n=1 Tax=Streptomyces spongiicola TaxID=1690221 RepID=A0A2S1YYR6_9ACTN|nr:DUF305 domain-containing protein [Streptomyces spongiicola]GBP99284.1 DUF305 domain-containing protein [Streptomyces spongiicola]
MKVVAAAVVALLALGACESGSRTGDPKAEGDGGAAVVAPGKPGEPARTLSPEQAARELPDDSPNAADVMYVQMMIVHHRQALEMTALVPDRAAGTAVKRLAERIRAAQQPEIGAMLGWLKRHGKEETTGGHAAHDHGAMPGMATGEQLARLRAAEGAAFDELFLKLMITHHQGALTMGAAVLSEGNNVQAGEMANDVIAQQTAEISRMRAM